MAIGDVMRTRVVTVESSDSARLAVLRMLEEGVGSVAVCDGGTLVGIFTERDVLRLAGDGAAFDTLIVREVMTRSLVTVSADADVVSAAELVGERKIRHLPVVEGENLLGVVGIRDVLRVLVERAWATHDPEARERAHALLQRAPGRPVQLEETP
jgi:CBS domain-containing protein